MNTAYREDLVSLRPFDMLEPLHATKRKMINLPEYENGLYYLFEPEYVNQRREEIDMEPIEDYLKKFGLVFNVVQKRK